MHACIICKTCRGRYLATWCVREACGCVGVHLLVQVAFLLSQATSLSSPLPVPHHYLSTIRAEPTGEESEAARGERARGVYARAYRSLRDSQPDNKEEAVMVLEQWKEMEQGLASL